MNEIIQKIKELNSATVVVASGELTFEKSPAFHAALVEICERAPARLVIDLSAITHIDSTGVGTLADILRRTKHVDTSLSLVGMNSMVRSVFEITRLDRLFSIFDTEEEALRP